MEVQTMTKEQKTALVTAVIVFLIAVANVFGFDIPVVPTV